MKSLVAEYEKMKHIDFEDLSAFEAVSMSLVFMLSISAGMLLSGNMWF